VVAEAMGHTNRPERCLIIRACNKSLRLINLPMLIHAALNGRRSKAEHPLVPVSSSELAEAALSAVADGAGAIHFHARGSDGQESLAASDVAQNLIAIRAKVKHVPLGVSTGAWIVPNPTIRFSKIQAWDVLPDFASMNFHEEGAVELTLLLLDRGVGVEAGVSSLNAARQFIASGLAGQCLRVLIEPQEKRVAAARGTAASIEAMLSAPVFRHRGSCMA
jgi:uncharacterized protein (DUF849 family)